MKGEKLFKSITDIEDKDIALADKPRSQRKRAYAWLAAAAALAVTIGGVLAAKHFAGGEDPHSVYSPTAAPTQQATAAPTASPAPTAQPTAKPTAKPSAAPTIAPTEAPVDPTPDYTFTSEQDDYAKVVRAIFNGEQQEEPTFTRKGGGVFFDLTDDGLIAYKEAKHYYDYGSSPSDDVTEYYEFFTPLATYPRELGLMAQKKIAEYMGNYQYPDYQGDGSDIRLFGFIGDNYVIFTNDPFHGYQSSAIFYSEDGTHWSEFGSFEGFAKEITGGCIVNSKVGYLCYDDRELMYYDDYTPRQLTVYKTTDGGKTWRNLNIRIPEKYEGTIAPPVASLSPSFDGSHGLFIVTYSTYNSEIATFEYHIAWFESYDGGETWEFHPWS